MGAKVKLRPRKDHSKFIKQFKYADHAKNPKDYTWSEIFQSLSSDVYKLALMLSIFGMFVHFAGSLKKEMTNSYLFQLHESLDKNDLTVGKNRQILDNLGYENMIDEIELDDAIESWRKPRKDLMYGNISRALQRSTMSPDTLRLRGRPISEMLNIFNIFKEIRQIIYKLEMQCFDRNHNICNARPLNKTYLHLLDNAELFNKQRCFCRHGQAINENTELTHHLIDKCANVTEYCAALNCDLGYHTHIQKSKNTERHVCKKNKCTCQPDLLTLPKYNDTFWCIFRKLKKFWRIFEIFCAFQGIMSIFEAFLG